MSNNFTDWSISENLFDWIKTNIPINYSILEIGSGTGTIELADLYNLTSIEHNSKWINLTDKCKYILAPLVKNWYNIDILKKEINNQSFDVIIVDAPNGSEPRIEFYNNLNIFNLKNTKFIIVDDTHRSTEQKMVNLLLQNTKYKLLTELKGKKNTTILTI